MAYDVTNFDEDVLNASFQKPVLVDFWAAWCAPCRVLGPILEKLADEQSDRWTLAKVDTESFQEVSAQYQIRGIPAVKLFINGEVVDEFTGALPENQVREWLRKAIPGKSNNQLDHVSELMESGAYDEARAVLENVLVETPTDPVSNMLMARLTAFSDPDRAAAHIATAAAAEPSATVFSEALKTLAFYREWQPNGLGDSDSTAEPGHADFLRAMDALAANNPEEVIKSLLEVIKVNRFLEDDASRKIGVAIFIILGDRHPLTLAYRRTFDMWLT